MGALHAGHLRLIARAREENSAVAASIFVNPLQFGANEDFARYPRAFADDCAKLEQAGVELLFAPDVEQMYPDGFAATVDPGPVGEVFEGALRPGHFRGVATVCTKLFAVIGAERVYFGAKDAQQVAVLRRVIADLSLPVEMRVVPTVREADGLALSSRNVYLTAAERAAAPALYAALAFLADAVRGGRRDREAMIAAARALITPPLREAYLDLVDPLTFRSTFDLAKASLAIGSVWAGATRLIDNVPLSAAAERAA
jgi:pantoate--beta-alanine ligase